MEGICLSLDNDVCLLVETLRRSSLKILKDLTEALERTPYLISSRPLIESSLKLSESLVNISLELSSKIPCSNVKEH